MNHSSTPQPSFFVTGTGTHVGKTLVSALLVRVLDADYWKPLQTGVADDNDDTYEVARLTGLPADRFHPAAYKFSAPLSPLSAARRESCQIDLEQIKKPRTTRPLIIEGAGGLMVPITPQFCVIDLISKMQIPTLFVVRAGLGAINHALLSIMALNQRGCPLAGVIMNGAPHADDADIIAHFGKTSIICTVPELEAITQSAFDAAAQQLTLSFHPKLRNTV